MKGTTILDKLRMIRVHSYSQHRQSVYYIYILIYYIRECDFHGPVLFSFLFFLQELIEVDSDVVFELASYILQVS